MGAWAIRIGEIFLHSSRMVSDIGSYLPLKDSIHSTSNVIGTQLPKLGSFAERSGEKLKPNVFYGLDTPTA